MSFTDDYLAEKKKKKKTTKTGNSFTDEYLSQREKSQALNIPSEEDIAPVWTPTPTKKKEENEERTWFSKGAFEDGYDFGDISRTIIGTTSDILEEVGTGVLGMGERVVDAGAYVAGGVGKMFGNDDFAEDTKKFIQKDLYDERKIAQSILSGGMADEFSVLGEKSDSLLQSAGQLGATIGLQALGVPWFVTSGLTSFGGEVEGAFNEGASYGEAGLSSAITAGAEILTEKISGGISFGGKTLDDALTKNIARNISNKTVRTLSKLGVDMFGEGAEEVLSGVMSAIGQKITYADDKELKELFSKEEAFESFVGGAVLGGGMSGANVIKSGVKGVDYASGLTANEEKVVNKVYNDRVAEAEKNGKITDKEKSKIYDEVLEEMEKGGISTDTIEEVLGGNTYQNYQNTVKNEDSLRETFNQLNQMKQGEMTGEQIDLRNELKEQLKELESKGERNQLKSQLGSEVMSLVQGDRLIESYNERSRRGQAFEADLTKYNEKQKTVVQKAIDSGILNNTRRTHEFVDMVSKISADKGVLFDFANNQKLKDSGFAVEGKTVNGFVTKDGVTLNIDSAKSLNSVVGHEITHVLEGTELYTALQSAVVEYAKTKGDYQGRYDSLTKLYENIEGANVDAELTADLVGDYLFTDSDFINNLHTNNRNVFQKIYDEIKYLCKVATAGSKEARELEKVKRAFEKAYKEGGKVTDTKYSVSDSDGKQLSKEQQEYFKDSKVRDESGNLKVMYHGSQDAGFHVFNANRSDDGISLFFVDRNDVAASYSGTMETYEAKSFRTVEDANNFFKEIGKPYYEVVEQDGKFVLLENGDFVAESDTTQGIYEEYCEWDGVGYGDANYKVYLNLKNPLVVDAKGRNWDNVGDEFNQNLYDRYQTLTAEEKEALVDLAGWEESSIFIDELRQAAATPAENRDGYGNLLASAYEKLGIGDSHQKTMLMRDLFHVASYEFTDDTIRDYATKHLNTRDYAAKAKAEGYDGVIFKNLVDLGGYSTGNEGASTVAIAFDSNQIKSVANEKPTADADIRYSLNDIDGKPIDTERIARNEIDIEYSLSHNAEIATGQSNYILNHKAYVTDDELAKAQEVTNAMVDVMMKYSNILPEDKIGKVLTKNGSYDRSVENTTICVRTLAYNEFVDKVQEEIGRPLTQMESFLVSQKLYDIAVEPQCLYCYVSLDRKAFNDMLLRYMQDRDTVIDKYKKSDKSSAAIDALYEEFLHGRKPTKEMKSRFDAWISYVDNGTQLLSLADIATEDRQSVIKAQGGNLATQLADARKYAQSASWSKIQKNYVAYRDEILKLGDRVVKNLNEHYGLRWYSFSDYSAAFIVENMQQITDASIRGLKGLSYTKDTDFAEIFAPSGMNINVSVFVNQDENGNFFVDEKQSANFEQAKDLRERYPNVGIVAVVTNDEALRWVGQQEWSDVIIPFHIVRTGTDVAEYYKWLNYTAESADTIADKDLWNAYVDSLNLKSEGAKKKVSKNIYPSEHKNDKNTYLTLCENRGLTPRFVRFAGEDWYMKLVNETRLSADATPALKPIYNQQAAEASFDKFVKKGGYEGGWYNEGIDVDAEAKIVAEDVLAGKKANEVAYGRQDGFVPEALLAKRKTNRTHGRMSLSNDGEQVAPVGGYNVFGSDVALDSPTVSETESVQESDPVAVAENAPTTISEEIVEDIAPTKETPKRMAYEAIRPKKEKQPRLVRATPEEQARANVLTEEPKVEKKKSKVMSWIKNGVLDKGMVFEDLSLKTGNRELQARWNSVRYAEGKAQRLMEKGNASVSSLKSIRETVEKSGKTKEFYEYLYHKHNADRMNLEERYDDTPNKPVFGDSVTSEVSQKAADKLEKAHPEFKQYAKEVYGYMNHLRELLVENGVISNETAKLWSEMYPHYVPIGRVDSDGNNIDVPLDTRRTGINAPIKKATGGSSDIRPLFEVMGERTIQTYKAIAKNRFGVELKNTLGTTIENETVGLDETIDSIEANEELLQKGKNGKNPTFTVFENGEKVTFEITDEMYDAMKPKSEVMAYTNKVLNTANNVRRGLLTEYNPAFMLTNPIKDTQDVVINSQHPAKTYANYPKAIAELLGKNGHWYQEYMENGGEQNTYFDRETHTFKEQSTLRKIVGFPLDKVSEANNFIERVPRMAEYIASRKMGRSIDVAMLDAARVTTNFAAGGDLTKLANRNGFTFLNASVQGAIQQVRNVREAKANGLKGAMLLASKIAVAGLPSILLNHLLWDDDEEYAELSDYVKQNYYIVGKYGDGKFVRIPKGRALAVIQNAFEQMENLITGNDDVDLATFGELVINNLAPSNPLENNLLAPIAQAWSNKTWYGDDLVPTRLQDLPSAEQYDETTDSISKWLGERTPFSPYKINYVLDQYSGAVGDMLLPRLTLEAERGDNSWIAPISDKFTTDSVMKNQNVSDFYDLKDELAVNANGSKATDEDVLKYKYINSVNAEMGKLYGEKREIQNGDLPDAEKYEAVREIQKQIDSIARDSLDAYNDVNIDGVYATVGDVQYRWYEPGEDSTAEPGWKKLTADQIEKQDKVTRGLGIDASEYWSNKEEYDFAYEKPDKYALAKSVGGYTAYKDYSSQLYDIKGVDNDGDGRSDTGTRKANVLEWINNLDADYGTRLILFKSEYPSYDDANYDIIEYLNNRQDISYDDMVAILKELGFDVSADGTISWD